MDVKRRTGTLLVVLATMALALGLVAGPGAAVNGDNGVAYVEFADTWTNDDGQVDDGDIGYTIVTAAIVSDDRSFDGLDPDDVTVTNTNDDTAGVIVDPTAGLVTTEAGGSDTFTVVATCGSALRARASP